MLLLVSSLARMKSCARPMMVEEIREQGSGHGVASGLLYNSRAELEARRGCADVSCHRMLSSAYPSSVCVILN